MRMLAPLCLALFLSGCDLAGALIERQAITRAEFDFNRANFIHADIPLLVPNAKTDLEIVLEVKNPNPVTARLDRLTYQILLAGSPVGIGALSQDFTVAAGATQELVVPVSIPYAGLESSVVEALLKRRIELGFKGTSHLATPIGDLKFPVEITKTIRF